MNITPDEFKRIDLDDVVSIWAFPNKTIGGYDFPTGMMPLSSILRTALTVTITVTGVIRMGLETTAFDFEFDGIGYQLGGRHAHEYVYRVSGKTETATPVASPQPYSGPPLSCVSCKTVNEYAEPNLPNNQLVCYSCRIWSSKLQTEFEQFNVNRS